MPKQQINANERLIDENGRFTPYAQTFFFNFLKDALTVVATANISNGAVTYAKIQNVSANKVLGRTGVAGAPLEIDCTAAGRALIDDADAATQRATLGLGTIALLNSIATANIDNSGVTTLKIADSNVTYAKIQNVSATGKLLGRVSSGSGVIEEITATTGAWASWTPVFTGFSAAPTVTARYCVIGKLCIVSIYTTVTGTSNTTGFTITGLPFTCVNNTLQFYGRGIGNDNSAITGITAWIAPNTTVMTLAKGDSLTAASWTAANNKDCNITMSYEIA